MVPIQAKMQSGASPAHALRNQIIDKVTQAFQDQLVVVANPEELSGVPRLLSRTMEACFAPIREPCDLDRATRIIHELIPPGMKDGLVQSVSDLLRRASIVGPGATERSGRLVMEVAAARVRKGESCKVVADTQCITNYGDICELEGIVIEGSAGDCVEEGRPCAEVAERFGLMMRHDDLIGRAIEGLAGWRVRNGERCDTVADEQQIRTCRGRLALEMAAVHTSAGRRVKAGESWQLVAAAHGIYGKESLDALAGMAGASDDSVN